MATPLAATELSWKSSSPRYLLLFYMAADPASGDPLCKRRVLLESLHTHLLNQIPMRRQNG